MNGEICLVGAESTLELHLAALQGVLTSQGFEIDSGAT